MKKKVMIPLITTIFAVVSIIVGIEHFQMNTEFNRDRVEYLYYFADTYAEVAEGILDLDRSDAMEYMKNSNIEEQINNLHRIIDEWIISLTKWEIKFNTTYFEPYLEIESVIALEYIYYLSKTEYHEIVEIESDEWYFIGSMLGTIRMKAENALKNREVWGESVDNSSIINGLFRDEQLLKDSLNATLSRRRVQKNAEVFINDSSIPDSKKTWVFNYINRDTNTMT
jgi:hypothetical protein